MTPTVLAIWFMDDGSKLKSGFKLATHCFVLNELEQLCELLKLKFNLNCSIHKDRKQYVIYIKNEFGATFCQIW